VTTLTTDQGLILPASSDPDNVPTSFASYNTGVESRLVKRYLSAADRTTRNPTPTQGELSYLVSTGAFERYDGSAWGHPFPSAPRGVMATRITASGNITTGSGASATEVRDTSLGNYVFTSEGTSRLYRVIVEGARIQNDTATVLNALKVRDGGGSTPTSASTLLGESTIPHTMTGGSSQHTVPLGYTFTASAGIHTLGVFLNSSVNTGQRTLTGTRAMYVEDIGLA